MESNKELLLSFISRQITTVPVQVEEKTYINSEKLNYRENFYNLKKYIDDFLSGNIHNRFITMPGLRGVGKSTLLFQLYDYLLNEKNIAKERILYLSTDLLKSFLDEDIYNAVEVFINEIHLKTPITLDEEVFIFIDEAQSDEKWSQVGKVLHDLSNKIFMIFTGSSALDFEINVNAVRRTKKETVYPLNFQEYLLLKYGLRYGLSCEKGMSKALKEVISTGNIDNALKIENNTFIKYFDLKNPLKYEWENYLCFGGFPNSIYLKESDIFETTNEMIDKIIEKDVSHYRSFQNSTKNVISNIITFLALQKPGEISEGNLANRLDVSPSLVKEILRILEKTHLIFSVKPYAAAGKTVRTSWKYYFLSPTLKSALSYNLGKYKPKERDFLGILAENLVASTFFKLKNTSNIINGIFYSNDKNSADFLLNKSIGDIIPVEVGIGNKNKKQVLKSMNKHDGDYGIVISSRTERIRKEDDIIFIPLTTFSFI
ncbi:MAG: ATP-binding protein [Methanobrevibacter sp. CfCl-M3]